MTLVVAKPKVNAPITYAGSNDFGSTWPGFGIAARPMVNILETEDSFELEVLAPGREKSQFTVEAENGILTIQAENGASQTREGVVVRRREFTTGEWKRQFSLPERSDATGISATYTEGILRVVILKREREVRRVEIA